MTTNTESQLQTAQQSSKKPFVEPAMEKVDITMTESGHSSSNFSDVTTYQS